MSDSDLLKKIRGSPSLEEFCKSAGHLYHPKDAWGPLSGEYWILNDEEGDLCVKLLVVFERGHCSMHQHLKKKETFKIVRGLFYVECFGREPRIMKPHDKIHIPPNTPHRFTGMVPGTSEILELSTYHRDEDSIRDPNQPSGRWSVEEFKLIQEKYKDEIIKYLGRPEQFFY